MTKVLVLHGYGQLVIDVEKKWARTFKKIGLVDVTYLEAPLTVTNHSGQYGRGWFLWKAGDNIYQCTKYYQVKESLEYLYNYINKHGPFDAIIGYSQGGTILSIFLECFNIPVRKIIIISSYQSLDPEWQVATTTKYDILLVAGQRDEIVPKQFTLNMYDNATIYIHPSTHSIPSTKDFIDIVKTFLSTPITSPDPQ